METFKVVETFVSINGEGKKAGRLAPACVFSSSLTFIPQRSMDTGKTGCPKLSNTRNACL